MIKHIVQKKRKSQNEDSTLCYRKHLMVRFWNLKFCIRGYKEVKSLDTIKKTIEKLTFGKGLCKMCKEFGKGFGNSN